MSKLIRRLRSRFYRWRLYAAHPELKSLVDEIETNRKAHRPTRHLIKKRDGMMLQALRGGR